MTRWGNYFPPCTDKNVMNANQAKSIPLTDLLQRMGYAVKARSKGGAELHYLSPWRAESKPSLFVNQVKNVWYDHGEGEGSNTLDFVIVYLEKTGQPHSVSYALSWLSETMGHQSFSFSEPPNIIPKSDLKLIKVAPLRSKTIFAYLAQRGIPPQLAQRYFVLVQYQNNAKPRQGGYYAFGQKNLSGGFEIRVATDKAKFKSSINGKDITLHQGRVGGKVSIFEGMLDHVSLLVLLNNVQLNSDAMILNSLASYDRAREYILSQGYTQLDLFLDNDTAADKTTQKFLLDFSKCATDHRHLYKDFKDLNKALMEGHQFCF